jgi:hypothetical protein
VAELARAIQAANQRTEEVQEDYAALRERKEGLEMQLAICIGWLGEAEVRANVWPELLLSVGVEAMARREYEVHQEELGREEVWEEETDGHRNIWLDAARERMLAAIDASGKAAFAAAEGER